MKGCRAMGQPTPIPMPSNATGLYNDSAERVVAASYSFCSTGTPSGHVRGYNVISDAAYKNIDLGRLKHAAGHGTHSHKH
jgi:hypothetical protein